MIGKVIGGALGAAVVAGGAIVLGYHAYQAYLEWLVSDSGEPNEQPPAPTAQPTSVASATES